MFSRHAFAILTVLASAVLVSSQCTRQYTVQQGDYCDLISAANNVSTYQLAALNPQIDMGCDNLISGEVLCLGTQGEDCTTTYVIHQDDTCDLIAQNHNINSTILSLNNPQINSECSNIYIGEVLCVYGAVEVPPAPAGASPAEVNPAGAVNPTVAFNPAPFVTPASATVPTTSTSDATPEATPDNSPDDDDDDNDDNIPWDQLPFCTDDDE